MPTRADVRKRLRAARRSLTPRQREAFAQALARQLGRHPLFMNSQRIAAYLPVDGEMDPMPLVWRAWELGKTIYLPVLVPFGHNRLWFAPFHEGDPLVCNRFGIAEPARIHHERANAIQLDLVLAPLVGFDPTGNRLGMGGGFYDRSFAFLNQRQHWKKPRLIGMAYECQRVPSLPHAPWDVPLHAIATEARLRIIGEAKS